MTHCPTGSSENFFVARPYTPSVGNERNVSSLVTVGREGSSFQDVPWGRGILVSMICFMGERGAGERRGSERACFRECFWGFPSPLIQNPWLANKAPYVGVSCPEPQHTLRTNHPSIQLSFPQPPFSPASATVHWTLASLCSCTDG